MKLLKVIITFFVFGCELEDPKVGISTLNIIDVIPEESSIMADGNDRVKLTATLGSEADANQQIIFKTDQGSFAGTEDKKEITITASGRHAEVFLVSDLNVNENVTISAKAGDFSASKTLEFTRVQPDALQLSANKLKLKANQSDQLTLTAKIFKDGGGSPSNNTRIDLRQAVSGENNLQKVQLPSFFFTMEGTASISLISKNDSTGRVRIIAFANDSLIVDEVTIELIKDE